MPWQRDDLETVVERVKNDIESVTGFDAHSAASDYTHIAHVVGGIAHSLYGMIEYYARQVKDDAKDDDILLDDAARWGIFRIAASFATGDQVQASGGNGLTIPVDTELQSSDGRLYETTAAATINNGSALLSIRAVESGAASNQSVNTELEFTSPLPGINTTAIALADGITGGADIEPVLRVRERLRERKINPPQGGSDHDYIRWAKAAHADVTRVWVYQHEGGDIGRVTVRFVTDNLSNLIPAAGHVTAVSDYLNQADVRPAGIKNLVVEAPVAQPMNLNFTSLLPNTPEVKASINNELNDLLIRQAQPGVTLELRKIERAIRAGGADDFDITLTTDIAHNINEMPVVGATTWP